MRLIIEEQYIIIACGLTLLAKRVLSYMQGDYLEVEPERTQVICFVTALANLRENFWTEFHLLENWVQNLLIAQRKKASTSQSTYTKCRNSAMSIQYLYNYACKPFRDVILHIHIQERLYNSAAPISF